MEEGFGDWLAGFIAGEGCFGIIPNGGRAYRMGFALELRIDDLEAIREIQRQTGIGRVVLHAGRGSRSAAATWQVQSKSDCLALIGILDCHPLRAKKQRDFVIWREAVHLWTKIACGGAARQNDWSVIALLGEQLQATRRFTDLRLVS